MNINFGLILRNLKNRVGFYVTDNSMSIPESAGIYGWFVPLYLYSDNLDEFTSIINSFFDHESGKELTKKEIFDFNWSETEVRISKHRRKTTVDKSVQKRWDTMLASESKKTAFKQALMEATILMPPLYVGKAKNLKERYQQHAWGTAQDDTEKNTFHTRFNSFVKSNESVKLKVDELLFVCITFNDDVEKDIKEDDELSKLLEQVLMKTICPPFSLR